MIRSMWSSPVWSSTQRVLPLTLALSFVLCACAEKHPADRLVGTWTATLASNASVGLDFSSDGKLKATFQGPSDAKPQTTEGTYKATAIDDSQDIQIEGVFAGQSKTLKATLLDGGNKLSLGSPPIELTRQP